MSRIRSIKPEFFQHERLFDAERKAKLPLRVAFSGLWTVADRDGRFEWRPRQIKLNVLPYDEVDFAAVLSALESNGFIVRYEVGDKVFGCIPSWTDHQHVNIREPSSTIPAPDETNTIRCAVPDKAGTEQVQALNQSVGKGKEGKGREREGARERALATPGLSLEVFERFETYRSKIRKPLTEHSYEATAKKIAEAGERQAELVQNSISNDWQGLFPEKLNGSKSRFDPHEGNSLPPELRNAN